MAPHKLRFLAKQISSLQQGEIMIYPGMEEVLVCMVMREKKRKRVCVWFKKDK